MDNPILTSAQETNTETKPGYGLLSHSDNNAAENSMKHSPSDRIWPKTVPAPSILENSHGFPDEWEIWSMNKNIHSFNILLPHHLCRESLGTLWCFKIKRLRNSAYSNKALALVYFLIYNKGRKKRREKERKEERGREGGREEKRERAKERKKERKQKGRKRNPPLKQKWAPSCLQLPSASASPFVWPSQIPASHTLCGILPSSAFRADIPRSCHTWETQLHH